jgi:hypothetical protein
MFRLKNLRASTFTDKTFATGSGYDPQNPVAAIALPARKALRKYVRVTLPDVGTGVFPVLDVGPYLWWDDDFLLQGKRPLVEEFYDQKRPFPKFDEPGKPWSKISFAGRVLTSRASVDMTPEVWRAMGIDKSDDELVLFSVDNLILEWFVEL